MVYVKCAAIMSSKVLFINQKISKAYICLWWLLAEFIGSLKNSYWNIDNLKGLLFCVIFVDLFGVFC